MKLEKLIGERFKERPAECILDSHALMIRGGYIKQVANGIFSKYPPLRKIIQKIEKIICEEIEKIGGQETLFPILLPESVLEESGRHTLVDDELVRVFDQNKLSYVFGTTHEETALQLSREYGQSYVKYPFTVYQVQTKFRDRESCRGGLFMAREFTTIDGYSFHISSEDLERNHLSCVDAFNKIFSRCGIDGTILVTSDSNANGKTSHRLMYPNYIGDALIANCSECAYSASIETAESIIENKKDEISNQMKLVHTPGFKTIEEVCTFLGTSKEKCCKATVYQKSIDGSYIVVFLRGDLDLSEAKLSQYLKCNIHPAEITDDSGLCAGYIGALGLDDKIKVLFDTSLIGTNNLVCGANKEDYHFTGFDICRDLKDSNVEFYDFAEVTEGGICPVCKEASLSITKCFEMGEVSQLGTQYTKPMGMKYTDSTGAEEYPLMSRFVIGVERLAACICELHHDDYGAIWDMSIAPWHVHICAIRSDNSDVSEVGTTLYNNFIKLGIEVIYDDRSVSAGVMFSDADLLGVPIRVTVSPRNCSEGVVELSTRDKSFSEKIPIESSTEYIKNFVQRKLSKQ